MQLIARNKSEQNKAMFDPWTGVHFGFGLAFGLMGIRFWPSFWLAVAYDLGEQVFERSEIGQAVFKTSGPENAANAVGDIGVFAAGWYLGDKWNKTT